MSTYYRVKKDTPAWKAGAIIEKNKEYCYQAIEDVWNNIEFPNGYQEVSIIIEAEENREWFERVYKDDIKGKVFRTADQVKDAYKKAFSK